MGLVSRVVEQALLPITTHIKHTQWVLAARLEAHLGAHDGVVQTECVRLLVGPSAYTRATRVRTWQRRKADLPASRALHALKPVITDTTRTMVIGCLVVHGNSYKSSSRLEKFGTSLVLSTVT